MFKNPLKYQQGGSTQNAMQQLVAWLVQNTGQDENTISERLNQILSDENAKAELASALQGMQKGDQQSAQKLLSMFTPQQTQMARRGAKIQDFICKHGRGGKADCGCGVEKGQRGIVTSKYKDTHTSGTATSAGDTTIKASYPNFNQTLTITPQGTMWRQWLNEDFSPSHTYVDQNWYNNRPIRYWLYRNFGIGPDIATGNEKVVKNLNEAKEAHKNAWIPQNQPGGKIVKSVAKAAKTFKPNEARGVFGGFSKRINPERYQKVVQFRLENDPNYQKALASMEQALQKMYNPDLAADYYRLKTFGATDVGEFLQFEDMMGRGFKGWDIANSLKPLTINMPVLGPGHFTKEGEQMVEHPYISGIGNFSIGGNLKNK